MLAAAAALPGLQQLQLSGCKKLSAAAPARLLAAAPKLRALTAQRCFQLPAAALGDVLHAAARPGARLAAVALSHLALGEWPEAGTAPPTPGSLRALALHNCSKLGAPALAALAAACPRLEVLMLGGAALALEGDQPLGVAPADGGDAGDGAASPYPLGGAEAAAFYGAAHAALLEGPCLPMGAGYASYVAGVVAQLAALVARMPRLHVLELSFALPGLAPALQRLAATEVRLASGWEAAQSGCMSCCCCCCCCDSGCRLCTRCRPPPTHPSLPAPVQPRLLAGRQAPLQVWDLTTAASVAAALQWRRDVQAQWCAAGGARGLAPSDADALLAAAVNCSSAGRQTPLHAAAADCDATQLRSLLRLGALVDARDRSGATPLFAACEAGHAGTVECLLGAGASATLRNSAGEAPLVRSGLRAASDRAGCTAPAQCRGSWPGCTKLGADPALTLAPLPASSCPRSTLPRSRAGSGAWTCCWPTSRPRASAGRRSACTTQTAGRRSWRRRWPAGACGGAGGGRKGVLLRSLATALPSLTVHPPTLHPPSHPHPGPTS